VTEVDRTVNASGNVSLGDHIISAGLPLTGQRVRRDIRRHKAPSYG
jgi:hypothetical protein